MANSLRKNVDMVNGPLFKNIWIYTVPVILTGILQLLFNAADLVVVGRFCGSVCVAAVGATGDYHFSAGFCGSGSTCFGQKKGRLPL